QAVLGELPQVERAARGAFPEQLGGSGRGQRPLLPQQADQRNPDRVSERPQRARICEALDGAVWEVLHACKDSFAKEALQRSLCKEFLAFARDTDRDRVGAAWPGLPGARFGVAGSE